MEITDEMRLKAMQEAREAALNKREEIQEQRQEEVFTKMNLSPEEIQQIIKDNQARAEANKSKIEKNQKEATGVGSKPSREDLLKYRKDMLEDLYTDIKKYKSLSQLDASASPAGKSDLAYEDRVLRQLQRKKNVGQNLGSLYD